jgi:hypothetical protein
MAKNIKRTFLRERVLKFYHKLKVDKFEDK